MNTKNRVHKDSAEKTVRDIRRATRRHYSAKEKIRIAQIQLPSATVSEVLVLKKTSWGVR